MIVRLATPDDFSEIMRLIPEMHRENGVIGPLSERKVADIVKRAILKLGPPPWPAIGVIGTPDHLEAIAGITIGCGWYTETHHVEDFIVFVAPKHRKSRHAVLLINWMKEQADNLHMTLIAGVFSSQEPETKTAFYGRLLRHVGGNFVHEAA